MHYLDKLFVGIWQIGSECARPVLKIVDVYPPTAV